MMKTSIMVLSGRYKPGDYEIGNYWITVVNPFVDGWRCAGSVPVHPTGMQVLVVPDDVFWDSLDGLEQKKELVGLLKRVARIPSKTIVFCTREGHRFGETSYAHVVVLAERKFHLLAKLRISDERESDFDSIMGYTRPLRFFAGTELDFLNLTDRDIGMLLGRKPNAPAS